MEATANGVQVAVKTDEEETRRQKRAALKELIIKQAGQGMCPS